MLINKILKLPEVVLFVFIIILLIFSISCNTENEDLTLGEDFVVSTTKIIQVDTFSLELSTVIVDSLITSATGTILVGCNEDDNFGKITANSFFQIGLPYQVYISIEEEDRFDSLTLVLPYSAYYYGDTNVIQELEIYRLSEELVRTDIPDYYNNTYIDFFDYPIGKLEHYPRPSIDSTVEIRIDDSLGEDLFEKLKHDTEEVSSNDEFGKYIYGFAIITNQTHSSSILGFSASDVRFNLYTSRGDEEVEEVIYEFPSTDLEYQFNQIICDRTGTVLENISSQEEELNSNLVDSRSFIQAGVGVLTKIRFPYLTSLLFDENKHILSIELILKPDIESNEGSFPESLYLYETNKHNDLEIDEEENIVSYSSFYLDEMYHLGTYYSFDITNFLKEQIDEGYIDNERCLLITVPSAAYNTSLERFIVSTEDDVNLKPRLNITYLEI